jgi:2-C-methyl-D-erythritol 2,4-cyclodiphosphate synthase
MIQTGFGYDSHRFAKGRKLVLGGVAVPHSRGLKGHSDADVVLHAAVDAILGAAALGDIGAHFPDSDPRYRGADSLVFLRDAVKLLGRRFRLLHLDVTVLAEEPRIGPYRQRMRAKIARASGLAVRNVSVKAKTNEGMGFVGRREGMAAMAVATVERR